MARPVACQTDMVFLLPDTAANAVSVVDIPRALSLLNRKSWRSGYIYSVDYFEYIGLAQDEISIVKIPEGYVANRSWSNIFRIWKRQRSNAMENEGTAPGKWSDFKCWMSQRHYDGTFPELFPLGMHNGLTTSSALITTGAEWNRAEVIYNDAGAATTSDVNIGMLGDHDLGSDYGGAIQAWGDTRAGTMSPDPNIPGSLSTSWISRTGEESSDMAVEVLDLIEAENDQPPYANQTDPALTGIYVGGSETAPGGVNHDSALVGTTGRAVGLSGGLFPLGLLAVVLAGAPSEIPRFLRVHVSRGKYKGTGAVPIGDFS